MPGEVPLLTLGSTNDCCLRTAAASTGSMRVGLARRSASS